MTTALVPFVPTNIEQAASLADRLAKSALLPEALRGKPADVLVMIITGVELGLSPMQSIRGLHVIKGKAVMSADLQVALVKKHSDCAYFRLVESTDLRAAYETQRRGEEPTKMAFTIDQAKNAGLLGNDNWRKYPAAMLRARCSSALARAVYPDLTMGVYDPDELPGEAPAPRVVEREVNEPPLPATGKRTAEVAATLAARRSRIVEVKEGETEAQAEAREAAPVDWLQRIKDLGGSFGYESAKLQSFCKGAGLAKKAPGAYTAADFELVAAALKVRHPAAEPTPDEAPPPGDADAPWKDTPSPAEGGAT